MAVIAKALSQNHRFPFQELVFYRGLFSSLALLPAVGVAAVRHRAELRLAWPGLVLRGAVGAASMVCYFLAIERISVSGAAMTAYTSPIWSALLAARLLGEKTPPRLYAAFPLSFVGVVLAAGGEASGDLSGYGFGLLSALLSGVAYATLRRLRALPPSLMVFSLSLAGSLVVCPTLGAVYRRPDGQEWAMLLLLATAALAAQWLMTLGYRYLTAARASTLGLATVGCTAVLAALFLGERLGLWQWLGMALIMGGSGLATPSTEE